MAFKSGSMWGIIGAAVGAVAASLCCLGPLVLVLLGAGGAGAGYVSWLEPYRPILMIVTFGFLGMAYFQLYRKDASEVCPEGTDCTIPRQRTWQKRFLWLVTAVVMILFALPYFLPTPAAPVHSAVQKEGARAVLAVEGMTCNGCVLSVTQSLRRIPGVVDVQVTLHPPRAMVTYLPQKIVPDSLLAATKAAGYPSTLITEEK